MGEMTRKLQSRREPVQEGSGTLPSAAGGGTGSSQNDDGTGQPLDGSMAQQGHQPAQGTEGGHVEEPNAGAAADQSESSD